MELDALQLLTPDATWVEKILATPQNSMPVEATANIQLCPSDATEVEKDLAQEGCEYIIQR